MVSLSYSPSLLTIPTNSPFQQYQYPSSSDTKNGGSGRTNSIIDPGNSSSSGYVRRVSGLVSSCFPIAFASTFVFATDTGCDLPSTPSLSSPFSSSPSLSCSASSPLSNPQPSRRALTPVGCRQIRPYSRRQAWRPWTRQTSRVVSGG